MGEPNDKRTSDEEKYVPMSWVSKALDELRQVAKDALRELGESHIERLVAVMAENTELRAVVERLRRQLPEDMQGCTVRFIECPVGHGRLTADNWVDQGCHWCKLADANALLSQHAAGDDPFTRALGAFLDDWTGWMSQEMYGESVSDGWEEQDREKLWEHIDVLWTEWKRRKGAGG